jgi:hypothetical protein
VAVFLSIVASITVLKDHNTRGTRQGDIKHVPRIRAIAPIRVLKLPKIGSPSSPNLDRDMSKLFNFICDFYDFFLIINL